MDKKFQLIEFVISPEFDKQWKKLKLSDDDLKDLQEYLCFNPDAGALISGTGGLRKIRWALPGAGKSGGIRVIYLNFILIEKNLFCYCLPKKC